MNIDVMRKWINALRSGVYEQGVNALGARILVDGVATDRFCATGVLCELAVKEGLINRTEQPQICLPFSRVSFRYNGHEWSIPAEVFAWLGVEEWPADNLIVYIAILNDEHRFSFENIANYLQDELDNYIIKLVLKS